MPGGVLLDRSPSGADRRLVRYVGRRLVRCLVLCPGWCPDRLQDGCSPRRQPGRCLLALGQGRRDDVAGGEVAVGRGVAGLALGEQGDVGAHDGIHRVLGPAQVALALGGRDLGDQCLPPVVVRDVQRGPGVGQALDQAHQPTQLGPELLERPSGLVLVLQGPPEPEERHDGRMGIDLDGPSAAARRRVHVQSERGRDHSTPRRRTELGLAGVGRVRPGVEPGEIAVERRLGRPVAGGIPDDQGCVDRDQAGAADVRRERSPDLVVGPHRGHVEEPSFVVERGEAGRLALAPREIDADEVHGSNPPISGCAEDGPA